MRSLLLAVGLLCIMVLTLVGGYYCYRMICEFNDAQAKYLVPSIEKEE
jgi:hypothetical protein